MEWDSKTSPWNSVSKLDHQMQDNSFLQHGMSNNMFSVDLKLGRLDDMRDEPLNLKSSRALNLPSYSSSSYSSSSSISLSKRGRPRSSRAQNTVSCLVDGCTSDLSQSREYHRRHRVCERHSKTPLVLIGGKEQRFCQQCSRFHLLGEFDDAKRSCRKRLDGHNRRRRKTQPENIYMINSNNIQSHHTENGRLQYSCTANSNRPVISEPQKPLSSGSYQHLSAYRDSFLWSTNYTIGDKCLPSLPGTNQQRVYQPLSNSISSAGTRRSILEVSPDSITESANSDCALSLLSRYSTPTSSISIGVTTQPMAMSSSYQVNNSALHLSYSLAQFSSSRGMEDESSGSLSSNTDNPHIFGGWQDGFSENGCRIFPFSWQ